MRSFEEKDNVFQNNNKKEEKSIETERRREQIIEGLVQDINKIKESLPEGVIPEMIDPYLGSDGKWHWHLKPEYIKDEQKRKEYEEERNRWP